MTVVSGRISGSSYSGNQISLSNRISRIYKNLACMTVKCYITVSMVYHNKVSVPAVIPAGFNNRSSIGCINIGSCRSGNIHSLVVSITHKRIAYIPAVYRPDKIP